MEKNTLLIVPVTDIKVGMALACPVTSPEQPEVVLLKAGYVLDQKVIDRLPAYGIEFIYVQYPGLDELDKHLLVNLSPPRVKMFQQMKIAMAAAQQRSNPKIPYKDYYQTTRDLIMTLMGQGQHPIFMDQVSRLGTDGVAHATTVAHLSLLIGLKMEEYLIDQRKRLDVAHAKEVVNLGVAGMLHDLGKMQLPAALRHKTATEPPAEAGQRAEWETHSRLGYEMCHNDVEPTAASAILHHHQHFDGTGFPVTKNKDATTTTAAGEKIHIFARILHAADLYDRLCNPVTGKKRSNVEVLYLMRTQYASRLDPSVLQTVHTLCPPFPPGSQVKLTDGGNAVVVQVENDIYRPTVRRMSPDGQTLEEGTFSLQTHNVGVTHVNGVAVEKYVPAEYAGGVLV
jgi:HD-GYP domain-containing protein (c-di-GMP phosphodiesterase class II)